MNHKDNPSLLNIHLDISNIIEKYHDYMVIKNKKHLLIPKITVSFYGYYHNDETKETIIYNVALEIQYINSETNKIISEFSIHTQMEFDTDLQKMFIHHDKLKLHPLYFIFFQGTRNSKISSFPSMSINVDDDFQGIGLARFMIQMCIFTLDNVIDNTIIQKYFGLPLNEQILAIDGDASDGFWDKIGMIGHRGGYNYNGYIPLRCVGMEKIITIHKLRQWAYSK